MPYNSHGRATTTYRHEYQHPMAIQRTGGKYSAPLLLIYTVFFWGSGLALIFIGLWTQLDPKRSYILRLVHLSEKSPLLMYAAVICILSGGITCLVGFVACCAALKRLRCMLVMFMIFLVVLFVADVAIGSLAVAYREQYTAEKLRVYISNMSTNRYGRDYWVLPLLDTIQFFLTHNNTMRFKLKRLIKRDYGGSGPRGRMVTSIIDRLQFYGQCCGSISPEDWSSSQWQAKVDGQTSIEVDLSEVLDDGILYPESCCRQMSGASALNPVARSLARCQRRDATPHWRHNTHACCGGNGPKDYDNSFWFITNTVRGTRSYVPPSCCKQAQSGRAWSVQPIDPMCTTYYYYSGAFNSSVNAEGCYQKLHSWLLEMTNLFMGVGFAFAGFQVIGLIISLILCNNIRYYTYVKEY